VSAGSPAFCSAVLEIFRCPIVMHLHAIAIFAAVGNSVTVSTRDQTPKPLAAPVQTILTFEPAMNGFFVFLAMVGFPLFFQNSPSGTYGLPQTEACESHREAVHKRPLAFSFLGPFSNGVTFCPRDRQCLASSFSDCIVKFISPRPYFFDTVASLQG